MMEVEYRREMNRNYLVIHPNHVCRELYTIRMLNDNAIQGLLPFQDKRVNGQVSYYFDITSRQPLNRVLDQRTITGTELRILLMELLSTLRQLERFLLDEGQLCLQPEYIYVEADSFKGRFCLIPGEYREFVAEFCNFSQYLLDHVNHRDGEAVVLAFSFFKECRKLNVGIDDLERCLYQTDAFQELGKRAADFASAKKDSDITSEDQIELRNELNKNLIHRAERKRPWKKEKAAHQEKDKKVSEQKTFGFRWTRATIMAAGIGFVMFAALAIFFLIPGIREELRFRRIFIAVEIVFGVILLLVLWNEYMEHLDTSDDIRKTDIGTQESDAANVNIAERINCENNINTANVLSPSVREQEPEYDWEEELWKRCFSSMEEETKESSEEAVMILKDPMNGDRKSEVRKLVSLTGDADILLEYFPFIIGKNK